MTAIERMTEALGVLAEQRRSTPCQGRRSERWTSNKTDELEWAAFHCRSLACPLIDLCGETADELHVHDFTWGGTVRTATRKASAS